MATNIKKIQPIHSTQKVNVDVSRVPGFENLQQKQQRKQPRKKVKQKTIKLIMLVYIRFHCLRRCYCRFSSFFLSRVSWINAIITFFWEGRGGEMRGAQLFIKKITVKILWNLNVSPCRGFLSSNVDQWRTINPMLIEKNEWRKKNIIKIRRRTTNQQKRSEWKKRRIYKRRARRKS